MGFQSTLSAWRLARGFEGELELDILGTLKVSNHFEQIARLRISVRAEHAHQAFRGSCHDATEFLKPVVALM
jgi:hypothetical protein